MKTLGVAVVALALAAPAAAGTVVKAAYNKTLKTTILVDARGMTLYEYVSDHPNVTPFPYCVDDPTYHCSKHWIPLYGTAATAQGGAKQSLLSSVVRPDGKSQITYHTWPLYTWIGGYGTHGDKKPGDVFGQGYAGIWFVLGPTGKIIHKMP
jgi:predicted lipoprotein with Yx(FWY)xxD motif